MLEPLLNSEVFTATAITTSRTIKMEYAKIESVLVNYYPSILENLKFKYATYLAFAIISYYVFFYLYKAYIKEGLIDCQSYPERVSWAWSLTLISKIKYLNHLIEFRSIVVPIAF